jgi:NAD(P)H-dependent FMN reductase
MSRSFLFLIASTRLGGNTEALARRAARSVPAGAEQRWLRLIDHPLPPFCDTRHSTGFAPPEGNARLLCEATLAATDLVLVTPVYWYSVSWPAKLYLDHWSAWARIPELAFLATLKGRSLWGVLVDSDREVDLAAPGGGSSTPVVDMLRRTAGYMKMRWRGALIGHGSRPGEVELDAASLAAAERYFAE